MISLFLPFLPPSPLPFPPSLLPFSLSFPPLPPLVPSLSLFAFLLSLLFLPSLVPPLPYLLSLPSIPSLPSLVPPLPSLTFSQKFLSSLFILHPRLSISPFASSLSLERPVFQLLFSISLLITLNYSSLSLLLHPPCNPQIHKSTNPLL